MYISLHNHTDWSDGKIPLHEMLSAAREMNLDEIGISDHLTCFPDQRPCEWSMALSFLPEYVRILTGVATEEKTGMKIRLGIEVDFFPENATSVKTMIDGYSFDYVISSVHFAGEFPIDESKEHWEPLTPEQCNEIWRRYWIEMAAMAQSGLGDIIGHLDLPKKFGIRPTVDLAEEEESALNAIAASGAVVEINTAGWRMPADEAYPSLSLLKRAFAKGIPITINADAHRPEHLKYDFDRARELAKEAGYREIARFENRNMIFSGI